MGINWSSHDGLLADPYFLAISTPSALHLSYRNELISPAAALEATRLGGITELKKLAAMAEAQSVTVAPHDGSVGPIVEMANVHVLASTYRWRCRAGVTNEPQIWVA